MSNKNPLIGVALIFLEVLLLLVFLSFSPQEVLAGIGSPSTEPITEVEIGNSYPEVHNISINDDTPIDLIPNSTRPVQCVAIVIDYSGENDVASANATFFDASKYIFLC